MTFEFDSKVNPQVKITDTSIENIQDALEKYNNHTHAIASTSNPFSMGLTINSSIRDENNESIPEGTIITGLGNHSIELSNEATLTKTGVALSVDDERTIYNCDLEQGNTTVQLNEQSGFIDSGLLENALRTEINNIITFPNVENEPVEKFLLILPSNIYYLRAASFILDADVGSTTNIELILRDYDRESNEQVNDRVIWAGQLANVENFIRNFIPFPVQTTDNNTLIFPRNQDFNEFTQIVLRITASTGNISSVNSNLLLSKGVL